MYLSFAAIGFTERFELLHHDSGFNVVVLLSSARGHSLVDISNTRRLVILRAESSAVVTWAQHR